MPQTVEVRFKGTRRDFFFWPDDQEPLHLREAVVVDVERGNDLGRVHSAGAAAEKKCGSACTACAVGEGVQEGRAGGQVVDPLEGESSEATAIEAALPAGDAPAEPPDPAASPSAAPVLRRATTEDVHVANELRRSEEDARRQIMDKVRQHKLEMKISDTEWQWDKTKLTVFFTAEKRVDFRGPGPGPRHHLSHPHRAPADRRARRSRTPDRGGPLRTGVLLLHLAQGTLPRQPCPRQGSAPLAQSFPDLRRLRPPALLPEVRARVLRRCPQALPARGQDAGGRPRPGEGDRRRHLP